MLNSKTSKTPMPKHVSRSLSSPKHPLRGAATARRRPLDSGRTSINGELLKPERKPRSTFAKLAMLAALLLGPLAIAPFSAMCFYGGLTEPDARADVIIVPGAALRNGGNDLSDALRWRMDTAISLWKSRKANFILVSGGGEGAWNEARAMARYAEEHGVPQSAILIEDRARTTRETGRLASGIMRRQGLKRALVVSQWFHVARTRIALEQAGVNTQGKACDHTQTLSNEPFFVLREAIALYAYGAGVDENEKLRSMAS